MRREGVRGEEGGGESEERGGEEEEEDWCIEFDCSLFVVAHSSMIEMSTYQRHQQQTTSYRHLTSFQVAEVNPGAPELLAQLFWTGASLLESDYQGEYTMALRLLSKVPGVWLPGGVVGVGYLCFKLQIILFAAVTGV